MTYVLTTKGVAPDPLAKWVLMGIANHADAHGRNAFPSQATLAEYAECSDRSVRRKLSELEALGVIARGDQRLVSHLPRDRRPVVWDIPALSKTTGHLVRPSSVRPDRGVQSGRTLLSDKPSFEPTNSSRAVNLRTREAEQPTPQEELGGRPAAALLHPERCSRHQAQPADGPCGGCGDARRTHETQVLQAHRAEQARIRAEERAQRQIRIQAIANCDECDTDGRRGRWPCDHIGAAERARRAAQSEAAKAEALRELDRVRQRGAHAAGAYGYVVAIDPAEEANHDLVQVLLDGDRGLCNGTPSRFQRVSW